MDRQNFGYTKFHKHYATSALLHWQVIAVPFKLLNIELLRTLENLLC